MIGRLIWYASLIAIAALTAAVQFDRQSAFTPSFATITPEPLRGFAQARIAAASLQDGPPQQSLEDAKLLAQRRPMPAEVLGLLARAQIKSGKVGEGVVTIQIAAQRGWRDRAAQEAVLRLALANNAKDEAARRFTALLLQNEMEEDLLARFGEQIFRDSDAKAIATMADILAGSERWHPAFLRRGERTIPAPAFAKILIQSDQNGARFDCGALSHVAVGFAAKDGNSEELLSELVEQRC